MDFTLNNFSYYYTNSAGEKYLVVFYGTTAGDCHWIRIN
jgi:hypothetical protein